MALNKAFTELQQKMIETTTKLQLADIQIDGLKRQKHHAELTAQEIKTLSPETKTYESVGRMFVLTEIPVVCKNLHEKISTCDEKIKSLESNKGYLERSLKDSKNNLREMVQQRKEAPQEAT
ncbi:prefoldin subunit 1-like isoform X2 [Macrosteles quadrilineatus]|uniref:prefoldin subunit 1-like isoform X2 n=1 Tax=Macrosteles quadrilineatus TaxID=74068 RepID=UPI0023E1EF77|nr:prefoldin subunit 1-like isoform X2 [Macrosteles quadrilineatus]XP_054290129.1 prefoldin subunit 1-like isoform X2 [Macrosteles quadrilineatus]